MESACKAGTVDLESYFRYQNLDCMWDFGHNPGEDPDRCDSTGSPHPAHKPTNANQDDVCIPNQTNRKAQEPPAFLRFSPRILNPKLWAWFRVWGFRVWGLM